MTTTTRATRFGWLDRLAPSTAERVAVAFVLSAIAFTIAMWLRLPPLQSTLEEYRAAPPCSATVGDGCVSTRAGTVTAAPNAQNRIAVESSGRSERFTVRLRDDQSVSALAAGTPVVLRSWRREVVELVAGNSAIQTDRHPEKVVSAESAWVALGGIAVFLTAVVAYCVRRGARNARAPRDAAVRAGAYAIPYVVRFRHAGAVAAFLVAAGVALAAVAVWVAPNFGVVMLALDLFMLLMVWLMSRSHVTLGLAALSYRKIAGEHVIRYADIVSVDRTQQVAATGKGVVVLTRLRLGLRGAAAADVDVTVMSERDRAVIVDRLQRMAPHAKFAPDLHILWTGVF